MQAKGENGELLKSSIQKIIEQNNFENSQLSIITNDKEFLNLDAKNLKNELINLKYTPNNLTLNSVILKLNSLNDIDENTLTKHALITDFQKVNLENNDNLTTSKNPIQLLKVTPKSIDNLFIDSLFITSKTTSEIKINVVIKVRDL